MCVSYKAIELIKKWEGLRSDIYICPAGYKTIGYGHVLKKGETFKSITIDEANELLTKDLYKIYHFLSAHISTNLNINQYGAIASFTYNVGCGAFQRSTLRRKINRNDFDDVKYEFKRWNKVNGGILLGLTLRREDEIKLFFS